MSLYEEYAAVAQKYKGTYGENLVVLYEVGSFLEFYDCDQHLGCNVQAIARVLNVQATRRNKSVEAISRQNPELGGIPRIALPKYLPLLLDADYTVVVVSQVTPPPTPKRAVTGVYSKGTSVEGLTVDMGLSPHSPQASRDAVACVYVSAYAVGLSVVQTSTGHMVVSEIDDAQGMMWDGARRFLCLHDPAEVIFIQDSATGPGLRDRSTSTRDELLTQDCAAPLTSDARSLAASMGLRCTNVYDWSQLELARSFKDVRTQNLLISRVFPSTGFLSPLEHCSLERRPCAAVAFVALLEFCFQHNEAILQRVDPPEVHDAQGLLLLQHNALEQLDVVQPAGQQGARTGAGAGGLLSLLDTCVTPVGRRFMRTCLLRPICDAAELERRYDMISACLRDDTFQSIRQQLAMTYDCERILRKIRTGKVQPRELGMLVDTVQALRRTPALVVMGQGSGHQIDKSGELCEFTKKVDELQSFLEALFDVQHLHAVSSVGDATVNFFRPGAFETIDACFQRISEATEKYDVVCAALNALASSQHFRVEGTEQAGAGLQITTTAKRFQAAARAAREGTRSANVVHVPGEDGPCLVSDMEYVCTSAYATTGPVRVVHPLLQRVAEAAAAARQEATTLLRGAYAGVIAELDARFGVPGQAVAQVVSRMRWLDFFAACAHNANELRHCRPTLVIHESHSDSRMEQTSFLEAVGLRHPIIEARQTRTPIVPNDVRLGSAARRGMLLYGVNAAGKSSLMKAAGLAVLMAQCGMYVAAAECTLRPYRRLLTRIHNRDNIWAGQSTFMAEVSELRQIEKTADEATLVLGDEVCSGTESVSAVAIVGAMLRTLSHVRASFMFATHLHELVDLAHVRELPGLQVFHMAVRTDPGSGRIFYDRVLAPGRGCSLYGLEVCQALGMSAAFMRDASAIRRAVLSDKQSYNENHNGNYNEKETAAPAMLGTTRASAYNRALVVNTCQVCKAAPATEVHHIQPQRAADAQGYIGSTHKNRLSNLVPLCEACHQQTHHGSLSIAGYIQTSHGVVLDISSSATPESTSTMTQSSKPTMSLVSTMPTMPRTSITSTMQPMIDDASSPKTQETASSEVLLAAQACRMRSFGYTHKRIVSALSARFPDKRITAYSVRRMLATQQNTFAVKSHESNESQDLRESDDEKVLPDNTTNRFARFALHRNGPCTNSPRSTPPTLSVEHTQFVGNLVSGDGRDNGDSIEECTTAALSLAAKFECMALR